MPRKRKRAPATKDLTDRLLDEDEDELLPTQQRFSDRSAGAQNQRMERTSLLRAAEEELTGEIESLPTGEVVQVYSL